MSSKLLTRISVLSIFLLLSAVNTAKGQTSTGTLQGTVSDPKGSIVPGATIKIQSVDTGLERTTVTESSGLYVFNFLPVGRYVVTASAPGFKGTKVQNVVVEIGQSRALDVTLEVGQVEQTIDDLILFAKNGLIHIFSILVKISY